MNSSVLLHPIRPAPGLRRERVRRVARMAFLPQPGARGISWEEQSRGRWLRIMVGSLVAHFFMALGVFVFVLGSSSENRMPVRMQAGSPALNGSAAEVNLEMTTAPFSVVEAVPSPEPKPVVQVTTMEPIPVLPPHPVQRPSAIEPIQKTPVIAPIASIKTQPRRLAVKAAGSGVSPAVSKLVVGAEGFPQPPYPREALMNHQAGTVVFRVTFDAAGSVVEVEVIQSSGALMLDSSARRFIRSNWRNAAFAGRSVEVPVEFRLADLR